MPVDLRQTHFRFGKDDGTEAAHTFWQLEDVNHSQYITADWTFLLRFVEQEMGASAAANTDAQFQYNLSGAGWVDITTTSSVVKAVAVGAFTNGQACTQRLSGTGTFETSGAGCTEDGSSGGPANDIAASGNSETEAGLAVVFADVANNDIIELRFRSPDWTVTYTITPTLTITKPVSVTVTPGTASLATTLYTPVLTISDNKTVTPGTASLNLTPFTPTVTVSDNKIVTPNTASLALTTYIPTVSVSDNKIVTPGTASLTLTTYVPTVTVEPAGITVTPGTVSLILTAYIPTVTATANVTVTPGTVALITTLYAPSVIIGTILTPGTAALILTAYALTVTVSNNVLVTPGTASLVLTAYVPIILLYITYGSPMLWTSANWGSVNVYLETYMRAISGTVYARLIDSDGSPVTNSEVTTTSSSFTRLRSSAITLANTKTYRTQLAKDGTGEFLGAKLVIVPA